MTTTLPTAPLRRRRGRRVRDALHRRLGALTLRGRAFVAAGITAVVCAIAFGQDALTRVGTLVLALPIIASLLVVRRRVAPEVQRVVTPATARVGEVAQVRVAVTGRSGGADLHAEETLPYALGARPRYLLEGLGGAWRRDLVYQVRPELRGVYDLGPLQLSATDPFGLVEQRSEAGGTARLVVTPRVLPLPAIPLTGGWQGGGEHRPQSFAAGSSEDASVREYRRGDDLRRVHWRSSARLGELMVRREEQPWEAQAVVLMDDRLLAHRGQGAASSLESAVVAAASIVTHLEQHGYTVRLATAGGPVAVGAAAAMRHLAALEVSSRSGLEVAWAGDQVRGGVLIAVLGAPVADDTSALRRLRHEAGTALAVVLDVDGWTTPARTAERGDPGAVVAGLGWRARTVGPRDRLDTAWRELGRTHAHSSGSSAR